MYKAKAKENKVAAGRDAALVQHGRVPPTLAEPIKPIETRIEIAKKANVSHGTIDKIKAIEAKAAPETLVKKRFCHEDFTIVSRSRWSTLMPVMLYRR